MDLLFFRTAQEVRQWLEKNGDKVTELWVGFYKKSSGEKGAVYAEVLDEALCFGWIDGVRKSIDEKSYTIRFTPRKAGSIWSVVNITRANELVMLGAMQPAGLKAFNERDEKKSRLYSYERDSTKLDGEYEREFQAQERAWAFFQAQPPSYRKTASWWVMSAKKDETRLKRLATLIEGSEKGKRLEEVVGKARAK